MNIRRITAIYLFTLLSLNLVYGSYAVANEAVANNEQTPQSRAAFESDMNERKKEVAAFKLAVKIGTVTAMQDFLSLYPASPFIELVKSTIERLQYQDAENKNTVEAFNYYLNEYPESSYVEKATYKRALLKHILSEYDAYLTRYPKGKWKKNIQYQRAMLVNTVEEYNNILKNVWPNNANVIYYRDRAALELAKEIGTKDAFKDFIDMYPNSAWIDQAKYFYKNGYDLD